MEEQIVHLCLCTEDPDAANNNFGWTRAEFCAVISEGKLTGNFNKFSERFNGSGKLINLRNYYKDFKAKMYYLTEDEDIAHNAVHDALELFPYTLKRKTLNGTWVCYGRLQGLFYRSARQFAIRELKSYNRKIKGHVAIDPNDNLMIDEDELENLLETTRSNIELNKLLAESIEWLKHEYPNLYAVFDLRINHELDHATIAEQLTITLAQSHQNHKRAKEHLQKRIAEEMKARQAAKANHRKPRNLISLLRKL